MLRSTNSDWYGFGEPLITLSRPQLPSNERSPVGGAPSGRRPRLRTVRRGGRPGDGKVDAWPIGVQAGKMFPMAARAGRSSDIVSKAKRSEMMRAVGQRDTKPERAVREMLRGLGVHYRRNHSGLPGRPDLANRTRGWAIFVHGCFWHGHRDCRKTKGGRAGRVPASNSEFWTAKIGANRERDARNARQLKDLGLRVLIIWECELRGVETLGRKIRRFLEPTL